MLFDLESLTQKYPACRGALEAICDRLLMVDFIVKCGGKAGAGLEITDELKLEMKGTWTQFARRLVYGFFTHGFVIYASSTMDVRQRGKGRSDTESQSEHKAKRHKALHAGNGNPYPYKIDVALVDIYVLFTVSGLPVYRVHAVDGFDTHIPLQNVFVAEMEPPMPTGFVRSAAGTICMTMRMGGIARACAAQGWQRASMPAVLTEANSHAQIDRANEPDMTTFDDSFVAQEIEMQRRSALSTGGQNQADLDDLTPSRARAPLRWMDPQSTDGDLPALMGANADMLPPSMHLPNGRKLVTNTASQAPAAYLGQIQSEIEAVSMAAGVPGEAFSVHRTSGNTTVVAIEAGMSHFDSNVHKYGICVGKVLEHMLTVIYGTNSAAEHLAAGRARATSVADTKADVSELTFVVTFTRMVHFRQVCSLFQMGAMSPDAFRRYVSRSMFIPIEDVLAPDLNDARLFGPGSSKTVGSTALDALANP